MLVSVDSETPWSKVLSPALQYLHKSHYSAPHSHKQTQTVSTSMPQSSLGIEMRNNNLGLWTEGMIGSLESPDTKKCCLEITHSLSYLYFSHFYQLWTQPLPSDHIFSHGGGRADGLDGMKMSTLLGWVRGQDSDKNLEIAVQ